MDQVLLPICPWTHPASSHLPEFLSHLDTPSSTPHVTIPFLSSFLNKSPFLPFVVLPEGSHHPRFLSVLCRLGSHSSRAFACPLLVRVAGH